MSSLFSVLQGVLVGLLCIKVGLNISDGWFWLTILANTVFIAGILVTTNHE